MYSYVMDSNTLQKLDIFESDVLDLMSGEHKDVLDVGYGWGISAQYFYDKGVKSLTIIEKRLDIYERAVEWSKDKNNVQVFHGDWIDILPTLTYNFDSIYMDTFCPEHEDFILEKTVEEQKKTLDYFFVEPSQAEKDKYISFESYCKDIAKEGCMLSLYEYFSFRKDINTLEVETDWGIDGYPSTHTFGWTFFINGDFIANKSII